MLERRMIRLIVVARKPLSEKSVAENVLKHGTGGLNIDATRISTSDKLGGGGEKHSDFQGKDGWDRPWMHDPEKQKQFAAKVRQRVQHAESLGRWPANLILEHKPDCRKVGAVEVKTKPSGPNAGGTRHNGSLFPVGDRRGDEIRGGYVGQDGTETVDQWECADGCPVRDLGDQSGVSFSSGGVNPGTLGHRIYRDDFQNTGVKIGQNAGGLKDRGTAARFFKQVQGKKP